MPFLTGIIEMKNKGKDKEMTERNELSASWLLLTVSFISCSHHFPISGCVESRSQDAIMEFLESFDSKRGSVVFGVLIVPRKQPIFFLLLKKQLHGMTLLQGVFSIQSSVVI